MKMLYSHFMHSSWSSGIVLIIFTVIAMILANLDLTKEIYQHALHSHFVIGFDGFKVDKSLEHWINDGLMVLFFFYVGLEIKREVISGRLSSMKEASLPIVAAIGGMVVPAAVYLLFNLGGQYESGWGVPMATDIAFAIGILSLMGTRVPLSLKIFLTALAIVDDLGAILVIALFYSAEINFVMLGLAVLVFIFLLLLNRYNVYRMSFYLIPSIILWVLFLYSGVHATISGVLIALTLPATPRFTKRYFLYKERHKLAEFEHNDRQGVEVLSNPRQLLALVQSRKIAANAISPSQRLEYSLHHVVAFFIMPVFALANAGVEIGSLNDLRVLGNAQGLGIFMGLVIGKPLGIFLFSFLTTKLGWTELPRDASWKALIGVAFLGGIGFTMSIFIDCLAFDNQAYVSAGKIAVLAASFTAAVIGVVYMRILLKKRPETYWKE